MKNKQTIIFLIVFLAYTSIYIARVNLSIAGPKLIELGCLDTVQIGLLGSIFSTIYSIGRLINGAAGDKTPPYKMLVTGLVIAGISNVCISFFPPFIGISLFWASNAFAQSMLWSSVLCVVTALYDKDTAKQKTSVMVSSVAVGNILGIIVNTLLITKLDVAFAFAVPGAITIILALLTFISTRHIPAPTAEGKPHSSVFRLLKNRELLCMCFPALFHGVMKENISLWMTVFIVSRFAVDLSTSSYYILLIPIIGLIGRIVYPFLLNLCHEKENTVSIIGFMVCIAASVALCLGAINIAIAVILLSIIYMSVSIINTSMLSIYPMHYISSGNTASVSGIMDFSTYLGSGISGAVYGVIIKRFGYSPMFISWAAISAISIIIITAVNQKYKSKM